MDLWYSKWYCNGKIEREISSLLFFNRNIKFKIRLILLKNIDF